MNDWSTRRYDFSFVIPHIAALTLTTHSAKILTRDGREQTVAIHWQCNAGIGHGSIRPMFVCQCGYGAFRLFDCFDALRCHQCAIGFGVRYASQQVSRKGRKYLQSQRLRRFLGEHPGLSTIHKPLFMQRKTYAGLLTKLHQIEANPPGRKYKTKRLTERTLEPNNMYAVQVGHIAIERAFRCLCPVSQRCNALVCMAGDALSCLGTHTSEALSAVRH